MARRLLSVAVTALLVHGCLLPQDDQVLDDLPPKKNSPPRILLELAKPGRKTDLDLGDNCSRIDFSVVVEDPDLGDRIRNRWFVDADEAFTTVSFSTTPLPASKTAIRNTPFTAPPQLFSAGSPLFNEPGDHTVTVVIADGEFEGNGIATAGTPHEIPAEDGGTKTIIDPSAVDYFIWDVTSSRTACTK